MRIRMGRNFGAKIVLDIIMTALLVILMDVSGAGLLLHEILGILISILFIIHNLLNGEWIKKVTKAVFSGGVNAGIKSLYFLDAMLTVSMGTAILSGILISKELFTFISVSNTGLWSLIHTSSSYLSLILTSVHIGFHWKAILYAFRKLFGVKIENGFLKLILRGAAIIFAVLGIRASFTNDIGAKLIAPFLQYGDTEAGFEVLQSNTGADEKAQATAISLSTQGSDEEESLDDYLSSLYCTGCHRRCPLISPQCSIGVRQAQQAEEDYYASTEDDVYQGDIQTESEEYSESGIIGLQDDKPVLIDDAKASLSGTFSDYMPVMGLYIAGAYYTLEFSSRKKKKLSRSRDIDK